MSPRFADDGALEDERPAVVARDAVASPAVLHKMVRRRQRSPTRTLLGLDLGTRTGWCLIEGETLLSGVQTFDVRRGESPGMRYLRLTRWLDEVGERVTLLVYELQHQRGGAASEIAAGFASHVQAWCAQHGVEHTSVHTATLKKFATGHGRAEKLAVIEAVRRRWKPDVKSDDEADAVALAQWGVHEFLAPRHA